MFPVLTSLKNIIDFSAELTILNYRAGRLLQFTQDLYIVLDGSIKIFQENGRSRIGDGGEGLRLSIGASTMPENEGHKIEKYKLGVGEVLLFQKDNNLVYIVSSAVTLLRIPHSVYSSISMSSFMTEAKKKQ